MATRKFSKSPSYRIMWPVYRDWWDKCKIKPERKKEFAGFVKRALDGKERYLEIERITGERSGQASGVPWWMVAIIAERESTQNWSRSIAQGDRWDRVSVHRPAGRGPFKSWRDAALDALHIDYLDSVKDWRLEKALFYWERFNGWGYYLRGIPSSYIWGATTIQRRGKYIADGKWDSSVWDIQLGCAGMLMVLMETDPTIKPIRET
jgi:lysozyme family protein